VLSRLFAGAVPGWDSGTGTPASAGSSPYGTQYYNPAYYPNGRIVQGGPNGFIQVP
jgi:hypothetical protein